MFAESSRMRREGIVSVQKRVEVVVDDEDALLVIVTQ